MARFSIHSNDWCHICGYRYEALVDIFYQDNAEAALRSINPDVVAEKQYMRICVSCAEKVIQVCGQKPESSRPQMPKLQTFKEWLGDQTHRKDLVGQFAEMSDILPAGLNYVQIQEHLAVNCIDEVRSVRLKVFNIAWKEYTDQLRS